MVEFHPHFLSILPSYFRIHRNKLRILRSQIWELCDDHIDIYDVDQQIYEYVNFDKIPTPELCEDCYYDPIHRKTCQCLYSHCICGYREGCEPRCSCYDDPEMYDYIYETKKLFVDRRFFRKKITNELVNHYIKKNELIVSMDRILSNKFTKDISQFVILPFLY